MIKISDFPYAKIDDIGVRFIEQINKYCKIHNVPMNNFDIKTNKPTQANFQAPIVKPVILISIIFIFGLFQFYF